MNGITFECVKCDTKEPNPDYNGCEACDSHNFKTILGKAKI